MLICEASNSSVVVKAVNFSTSSFVVKAGNSSCSRNSDKDSPIFSQLSTSEFLEHEALAAFTTKEEADNWAMSGENSGRNINSYSLILLLL